MPTATMMHLPKTYGPEEFEKICKDVISYLPSGEKLEYETFATKGEEQYGIDLKSKIEVGNGKIIGVQCKNYIQERSPSEFVKAIKDDLEKAYEHFPIERFIAMTAIDKKKGKYQTAIDKANWGKHSKPIVYYWDEIEPIIAGNPVLLQRHYPSIFYSTGSESFGTSERYFYNPENDKLIEGLINICPRKVYFGRDNDHKFRLIAEMFICNGKHNDVVLRQFKYLTLASDQEILCELPFDLSNDNIRIESGKSRIHTFLYPLETVSTSQLTIPNRLRCMWNLSFDDIV